MNQLIILIGTSFILGASSEATEALNPRNGKSLVQRFPFNVADIGSEDHHQEHHDHHDHHDKENHNQARQPVSSRTLPVQDGRQRSQDNSPTFSQVAATRPGNNGKKCVDKVEMVEVIEYTDVVQCDHSYDNQCHTTYVTNYDSQQEEECEENFRKTCYIDYEKVAFNETVEICRTPLVKDCKVTGPEICRTEYESECWTTQEEHQVLDDVVDCTTEYEYDCGPVTNGYTSTQKCSKWPKQVCSVTQKATKKFTPVTGCHKEPVRFCAPAGCKLVPGNETCHDEIKTVVQDKPKEECTLEPQRTCKHVTKLVPKLTPTQECVDVPKEVCTRSRVPKPNPVRKPVVKKWCYTPSLASGLN